MSDASLRSVGETFRGRSVVSIGDLVQAITYFEAAAACHFLNGAKAPKRMHRAPFALSGLRVTKLGGEAPGKCPAG